MMLAEKRALGGIVCAAVVLAGSAAYLLAADSAASAEQNAAEEKFVSVTAVGDGQEDTFNGMVKVEDGETLVSYDNGETWSSELPEGMKVSVVSEDGAEGLGEQSVTVYSDGTAMADGVECEMVSVMAEEEDGQVKISYDGGETWSELDPEALPDGMNLAIEEADGTTVYTCTVSEAAAE
ncbi:MAG: glycoside hydrolase [Oscillospiraceae bacterium]|nr:glycoside hydrolase [Oscillospiraceae bacterium]